MSPYGNTKQIERKLLLIAKVSGLMPLLRYFNLLAHPSIEIMNYPLRPQNLVPFIQTALRKELFLNDYLTADGTYA
jgi:UDP-glucose 4-epimerase